MQNACLKPPEGTSILDRSNAVISLTGDPGGTRGDLSGIGDEVISDKGEKQVTTMVQLNDAGQLSPEKVTIPLTITTAKGD